MIKHPTQIRISPAMLAWIHRTPSERVAVHRDRWKAVSREEQGEVEVLEEGQEDGE